MSDDELKAKWAKIDNLPDAVDQFMEHSMYVGTDPYYADMNDALWAMLERCRNIKPPEVVRRLFPILNGEGAKIDYQLVADHAEQARKNHYQSVDRLAERGGLSWCELYAVLHNRKWEKVDTNDAMIACRSLEARYLAGIKPTDVTAKLAAARETFCMASPGSDEEFTSLLLGFDTAAAIINGPKI